MSNFPKRYIFVDYDSLAEVQFSKLEKVCSKVYIIIDEEMEVLPVSIVLQAQQLGKRVKWITAEKDHGSGFILSISFLLGSLHERVSSDVEFAILSNDEAFDTIVEYINNEGRNCLRITTENEEEEEEDFSEDAQLSLIDKNPPSLTLEAKRVHPESKYKFNL